MFQPNQSPTISSYQGKGGQLYTCFNRIANKEGSPDSATRGITPRFGFSGEEALKYVNIYSPYAIK